MARPKAKAPARRYHLSGQSVVRLNGRDYYLGPHDSPAAIARYAVLIATYQAGGLTLPPGFEPARSSATTPAVTEALAAAGVERTRSLLAEAERRRITAAELIDAAYVCQHWSGLSPGALFDWVRSGGWPASGVPPADVLRHERRKAAEAIRSRVQADASEREIQPPACVVAAVTCRRLRATKAKGCKTDLGDECTPEELRGEAEAARAAKTEQLTEVAWWR